jgi:hypothetical protein
LSKGIDVLKQLNKAFAHCWSSEVVSSEEVHGQILVQASVSVFIDGDVVVHHGFASAAIARKNEKVIDIGNAYKSAYTGAIKKAAEQFGIGLGASDGSAGPSKPAPTRASSPAPQHQTFSPPPKKETSTPSSRPSLKPAGGLKPRVTGTPAPASTADAAHKAAEAITGRMSASKPNIANKPRTITGPNLGYDSQEEEWGTTPKKKS